MSESPSNHLIRSLTPRNILSFGPDTPEIELRPLNVIIGTNGSGKSNLIEVINLMRAAPKDWSEVTRKNGGVSEWIWKGAPSVAASVDIVFDPIIGGEELLHSLTFACESQRFVMRDEKITESPKSGGMEHGLYFTDLASGRQLLFTNGEWQEKRLRSETTSILAQVREPESYPDFYALALVYDDIRIYREWTFGRNTVFRVPQQADMRRNRLEEDFSNLGLFLNRLKTEFPAAKRALLKALQALYDGITDFEVNTNGGTVQVFLHEGDFAIPATRLSDGTLRYLCLLAILCDPEPPPLICIEEPELGLHPDILPGLADLLRTASERTQIIITTHSDILVDAMTETPECVLVCEKHEGKTEMTRLSSADLSVWLEKYRLGQLWIDGQLGGKRW
jgi:predicted ATPase